MTGLLRYWALGVAALILLAGCAGPAATAPTSTGQGPAPATSTGKVAPASGPSSTEAMPATSATTEVGAVASAAVVTEVLPAGPAIACTPGALTPEQTEGPYYKANPPETASLMQPGMGGTKLIITGYVLDAECQPVPGARVDFWQADNKGQYDNQSYTLRGYQMTDARGRYAVETVLPGLYPGRTRHIHVKVTAPNGPTLTTQLYFPDEVANASDAIYSPQTVLTIEKTTTGEQGTFDFVINTR
jgi:protocatechuate 3,4-dioxygenase beta subunit